MNAVIKQRKCKNPDCEIMYTPFPGTTLSRACSLGCALILVQIAREKKWRREKRARKDKLKTLSDWTKEAQVVFNKYIRLRDKNLPCISCGISIAKWDAGHFKSIGGYPELRFREDNCHKQCAQCNSNKSGNIHEMRKGMIARIGLYTVMEIEGPHHPNHYIIQDVKDIKEFYKLKIKEMEE